MLPYRCRPELLWPPRSSCATKKATPSGNLCNGHNEHLWYDPRPLRQTLQPQRVLPLRHGRLLFSTCVPKSTQSTAKIGAKYPLLTSCWPWFVKTSRSRRCGLAHAHGAARTRGLNHKQARRLVRCRNTPSTGSAFDAQRPSGH